MRVHTDPRGQRTQKSTYQRSGGSLMALRLLTVLGAMVAVGCSALGGLSNDSPKEAKQERAGQRAQARWDALIRGDLNAAYEFLSPGSRAVMSLAVYKGKLKPGLWRSAKVRSVECEADVCSVKLVIDYDVRAAKGIETPLTEKWIIESGDAWYVDRN
jgi:hypothetical protein